MFLLRLLIWKATQPCLWKVFELLQMADQKVRKDNVPTITLNLLKKIHLEVRDLKSTESDTNSQGEQAQNAYGPHEQQAIARQTSRQRR